MTGQLYLAHHGIKGMKWGVRRFQNPDGSLTAAGKKRYLQGDGSLSKKGKKALTDNYGRLNDNGLAYYNSQGYGLKRREHGGNVYNRVSGSGYFAPTETATGKGIEAAAARLKNNADNLLKVYSEAQQNAEDAITEVSSLKEAQSQAQKYMKDALGPSGSNDAEWEEYIAWEAATITANNYAGDTPSGKKADAYQAELDKWWNDAKQETARLVADKSDVVIGTDKFNIGGSDTFGKGAYTYEDVVYSTLVDSASSDFFAFVGRNGVWEPALVESTKGAEAINDFADQILAEYRRNLH